MVEKKEKNVNKIPNRQVICEELMKSVQRDKDIIVLASDSRGSASMAPFAESYPDHFVEVGIAEQNLIGIAAGMAACGKKTFVTSPACFVSMRSAEQVKVDMAYSNTNVKLVGISGGISYGALGMSHHSVQDLAIMRTIPNMTVIMPADRLETEAMIRALLDHIGPTYIRVGRNPVEDVYEEVPEFVVGKANYICEGSDISLIACGETVAFAKEAARKLKEEGIEAEVINMHTIKPLDEKAILATAKKTGKIITIEEHSVYNGLGAAVAEVLVQNEPVPMKILGIPDEPAIAGTSKEVYAHYGLDAQGIVDAVKTMITRLTL